MNEAQAERELAAQGSHPRGNADSRRLVLKHMRERLSDYQEQYVDLYNLEATPAESTAYRLAKHDKALSRYHHRHMRAGRHIPSIPAICPWATPRMCFLALDVQ